VTDEDLRPGGSRAYRHAAPERAGEHVDGDPEIVDAVPAYIEQTLGPINLVWHEIVSERVHVDVYHIAPSSQRPFHVLVTSGMSQRPMIIPVGVDEDLAHAELLMCLPRDWPVSDDALTIRASIGRSAA